MLIPRHDAIACAWFVTAALAMPHASAQREVVTQTPTLFGGWTLNRELSSNVPPPDAPGGQRPAPPAGGPGAGPAGGGHGGPGGGFGGGGMPGEHSGGFGGRGGPAGPDPRKMEETMDSMRELMTATQRWVISEAQDGRLVFSDAEGHSVRYTADNKKEKHQLAGGTIETKTKWDNGSLRQEIQLAPGMKLVREFALAPGEVSRMIVTTKLEGGEPGGQRGQRPPAKFVYDRDQR